VSDEFKRDSEIKARYALAVLKAAQAADRETAARLILGLSRDLPHPNEMQEVAALHFESIEAFEKLAESFASLRRQHPPGQQRRLPLPNGST